MILFSIGCDEEKCIFEGMGYRHGINPIFPNNTEKLCLVCPKMYVSYCKDHKEYINL